VSSYLLRRVINSALILFAVSVLSFYVLHAAPGDPIQTFLQQPFSQTPQHVVDAVRHEMGLDQPVIVQYTRWLTRFTTGDMGYSLISRRPVVQLLRDAIPNTFLLMAVSTVVGLVFGIALGVFSALRPNSWLDSWLSAVAAVGYALPSFWVALVLIYLFSFLLSWLPASGMMSPYAFERTSSDVLRHMILPVTALTINEVAFWQRYQRDSLMSVLTEDYVRTAHAKGLRSWVVVARHAWRNSLVVIITLLGLSVARLLTGSYIVESVFSWPGMGHLGIWAINNRDYPVIMAILMLSAVLVVVGNLLADLAYSVLDPRTRVSSLESK
jgi:peptide/nickel transport system permease protein